jgi:hypothetical protein
MARPETIREMTKDTVEAIAIDSEQQGMIIYGDGGEGYA